MAHNAKIRNLTRENDVSPLPPDLLKLYSDNHCIESNMLQNREKNIKGAIFKYLSLTLFCFSREMTGDALICIYLEIAEKINQSCL